MAKVTGLGGVFYKVADPKATQAWYQPTVTMLDPASIGHKH